MGKKDNKGLLIVLGILAVILIFMFGNFQTGSLVSVEPSTIDEFNQEDIEFILENSVPFELNTTECLLGEGVACVGMALYHYESVAELESTICYGKKNFNQETCVESYVLGINMRSTPDFSLAEILTALNDGLISQAEYNGIVYYTSSPELSETNDFPLDDSAVNTYLFTDDYMVFGSNFNNVNTIEAYIDFYFEEDEPENTTTQVTCWHIVGNDCTSYTATKEAGETNTQACSPGYINQLSCEGALPTSECPAFISKIGEPVINADMGFSNPCKAGWTVIGVIIGLIILFMLMKGGK